MRVAITGASGLIGSALSASLRADGHEVLAHRWYLAERAGHDIDTFDAAADYIATVLRDKPEEAISPPPAG